MSAVGNGSQGYCSSCYTGVYPVAFPKDEKSYLQLALKLDKEPAREPSTTANSETTKEPVTN